MIVAVFSKWQTMETVELENESWFTRIWLANLWKYLHDHFSNGLHPFENLHILALGNGRVAKLSQQLPVVSRSDSFYNDEEPLQEELVELCNQVGVMVVEDLEPEILKQSSV